MTLIILLCLSFTGFARPTLKNRAAAAKLQQAPRLAPDLEELLAQDDQAAPEKKSSVRSDGVILARLCPFLNG
jgi:hypothetical protein